MIKTLPQLLITASREAEKMEQSAWIKLSDNLPAAAVLENVQISVVGFGLAGVRLRTAGASGRGELQQTFCQNILGVILSLSKYMSRGRYMHFLGSTLQKRVYPAYLPSYL